MNHIKEWLPLYGFGFLVLLGIGGCILAAQNDSRDWAEYQAEHHCVVGGHIASSIGITSSGKSVYEPGKTIYHCDNNQEEIR